MNSRPSTAAPILAVLIIVLAMLGTAYVGGYFWLGQRYDGDETAFRVYPQQWMATAFEPAARFETWLTGVQTTPQHLSSPSPTDAP
jgi:hypothetical protein